LLDTVEEIESVENEFWDEIFERVGGQIKQSLIEFETKNESSPISVLNIITDKIKIENFSIGLERQLGEMVIKQFNPKDTFDFSDEAEKYLDSLKSHSLISESLGIALRKVNPFEINTHEMFSFNLLPRSAQLKINRKSLVLGKTCLAFASFFIFITLVHLLPFKIPQIFANTNKINEIKTFNEDIESKTNILNGYGAKVKQLKSKTQNIIGLGSNILTTATVYKELNEKTPENVRFVSLKVSNKDQIIIAGVAKDDQSVVEMMNNLTTLDSVKETKIETLIGLSEEDRIALYTTEGVPAPKLEDLPKEIITKKFTISLKLNSVEGEKFDDEKIYAELVKRTKKK
jgi:type IV pilus assembly protein PilN